MKRLFLLAALCVSVVPASGQTLNIAVGGAFTAIDPNYNNVGPNNVLADHIFSRLVRSDPKFNPEPDLALSWAAIGPTEWEFKLREGVTFTDGTVFPIGVPGVTRVISSFSSRDGMAWSPRMVVALADGQASRTRSGSSLLPRGAGRKPPIGPMRLEWLDWTDPIGQIRLKSPDWNGPHASSRASPRRRLDPAALRAILATCPPEGSSR
jgi:hypothetical protein